MKITVKESSIICPAEDNFTGRICLSNLDLVQGNSHIPIIYVYKPDGSSNFFGVKLLKEALSKVLVPFYPLAGRFGRDENGRMEINCNGEGVLFFEAEADCPINYFNDFMPHRVFVELVPKVDCSTGISSFPFFLAQVTKFSCGGVCVGVLIHHQIVDGQAAFHFMNSWSEIARGLSLTIPPVHERSLLRARDPPTPKFDHIEYHDEIPKFKTKDKTEERVSVAVPRFSVEFVNSLKAKVISKESDVKYTTFETLSAHIWRITSKLRKLPEDQENSLFIPVNTRQRLHPPLPEGYFGNAAFLSTARASTAELIEEPLEKTVERIHKAIIKINDDYIKSGIDYLEINDPSKCINALINATLIINTWTRLNLASTDFGWGGFTYMQLAAEYGGVVTFLSSPKKNNTISVYIGLPDELTKSLEKLIYELE